MKLSKKQTLKKYTESLKKHNCDSDDYIITRHYFFFRMKISQFLQDLALIVQQILGAVHSVVWATKVNPDY